MKKIEIIRDHAVFIPAIGSNAKVLDLGANRGGFSKELATRFGCECILVEANPDLCSALSSEGFAVRNLAVGCDGGLVQFNISTNPEGSSVHKLPTESVYGSTLDRVESVPSVSLSSLVDQFGCGEVDLLKMDIEGAEIAALASLSNSDIAKFRQITVEFHDDPSFQLPVERAAVLAAIVRFRSLGFLLLNLSRPRHTNVLVLGPQLGLSMLTKVELILRYDIGPFTYRTVRRWCGLARRKILR